LEQAFAVNYKEGLRGRQKSGEMFFLRRMVKKAVGKQKFIDWRSTA
jgi:hypothetical protein